MFSTHNQQPTLLNLKNMQNNNNNKRGSNRCTPVSLILALVYLYVRSKTPSTKGSKI